MKKNLRSALMVFVLVTTLALLSNFIRWDETPIEETIAVIPLGIGLILEAPFFVLMGVWLRNADSEVSYQFFWIIIPILAGTVYAWLYYRMSLRVRGARKRKAPGESC